MSTRTSRIADQIQRELAELVRTEVRDPRVGMVTLTAVELSRDQSHAKVFFTVLGPPDAAAEAREGLERAAGFLRSQLARGLTVRKVPELHFAYDSSVERGVRLSRLIDEAVAAPAVAPVERAHAPEGEPAKPARKRPAPKVASPKAAPKSKAASPTPKPRARRP